MTNRIAVSLGLPDTASCLASLQRLAPRVGLAEIRLDLMQSYDLPRLIAESPVPLIITCRAAREGGSFGGSEAERLAVLREAIELGSAYIDVEWDSVGAITTRGVPTDRIIASRHWYDQMPDDLMSFYERLHAHAHVVKLVGQAERPADMLPILSLLHSASSPVIAIAMGASGQLTRILGPCFASCFLTYGTVSADQSTAPGQLTVDELVDRYRLQHVGPQTVVALHLCATEAAAQAMQPHSQDEADGATLHLPLVISAAEVAELLPALRRLVPRLRIVAESDLPADVVAALAELPDDAEHSSDLPLC